MTRSKTIALVAATAIFAGGTPALATHLITSADVKNGSLAERDLRSSVRSKLNKPSVPGPAGQRGVEGAQGPLGARGATGPQGEQGEAGRTGAQGPQGIPGTAAEKGDPGDPGAPGTDCAGQAPADPARKCPGEKGDKGDDGVSGLHFESISHQGPAADGAVYSQTVQCDEGEAIAGGYQRGTVGSFDVTDNYVTGDGYKFRAILHPNAAGDASLVLHLTCITAP
jgi:hypothetical protein